MKHPFLLFSLAILAAILLFACSSDSSDDIASQKFKVDISGTVMDSKTKAVLEGVTVGLASDNRLIVTKISDENGAFSFGDLDEGTYSLRVSHPGYEEYNEKAEVNKKGYTWTIQLEPSATTFLTIENKSSFALENVVWNGVEFGSMAVNAEPVRKSVSTGSAYITFYVPSKELNLKTSALVEVKQDADTAYSITDILSVEEIGNDNQAVLSSIKKIQAPKAEKVSVTDVSYTSAKLNSRTIEIGNPEFTERGFCYSRYLAELEQNVNCSAVEGVDFSKTINDLDDAVKYYVKAYMENSRHGRQFSEPDSFVTRSGLPNVAVNPATDIQSNSALLHARILATGEPAYSERGFCYSSTINLPQEGSIATICRPVEGNSENFELLISSLEPNTKYYFQAYAKNIRGTKYGETAQNFTTKIKTFSLSFDPNGGTINGISDPFILSVDSASTMASAYETVQSPIRTSYVFDDWYASPVDKTKYTSTTVVKGNLNLYAHWVSFADRLVGGWQDLSDANEDAIRFNSDGKGYNQWYTKKPIYVGYNFTYTATNSRIAITVTEVYWYDTNNNRKVVSSSPDDIRTIVGSTTYAELSYSISVDGNTLHITDWNRIYERL